MDDGKEIHHPLSEDQVKTEYAASASRGYSLVDWVKIEGKMHQIIMVEKEGKLQTYVDGQLQNEAESR